MGNGHFRQLAENARLELTTALDDAGLEYRETGTGSDSVVVVLSRFQARLLADWLREYTPTTRTTTTGKPR